MPAIDTYEAYQFACGDEIQGDSTLDTVLNNFGLDVLPAGYILDIGSGIYGALQYDAAAQFPDAKVVGVNPIYGDSYYRSKLKDVHIELSEQRQLSQAALAAMRRHNFLGVAGYAQQLPFASGKFDLVISHASVPVYLPMTPDNEHYRALYGEALRVTKPTGSVIFAPMYERHKDVSLAVLEELGVPSSQIIVKEIPVPDYSYDSEPWFRVTIDKGASS